MDVRILILAEAAYACIKTDTATLDVRLSAGKSASDSLRETAQDWRAQAARLERRAKLAEEAATVLQK